MGGKRLELSLDDYILGSIMLYLDIINIFLYILAILSSRDWIYKYMIMSYIYFNSNFIKIINYKI